MHVSGVCSMCIYSLPSVYSVGSVCIYCVECVLCVCVEGTGHTEGGRGSRREKDGAKEEGYQAGEADKDEDGPGGRRQEGGKA